MASVELREIVAGLPADDLDHAAAELADAGRRLAGPDGTYTTVKAAKAARLLIQARLELQATRAGIDRPGRGWLRLAVAAEPPEVQQAVAAWLTRQPEPLGRLGVDLAIAGGLVEADIEAWAADLAADRPEGPPLPEPPPGTAWWPDD